MTNFLSHNEILSQYVSMDKTLDLMLENAASLREFFTGGNDIVFIGCGSSYWMSLSAHKTMKLKTGRRTYAIKAGDVVLCPEEFTELYNNPVFVCPSRSGRTQEVLDAIGILKDKYPDAKIFSVIIYSGSILGEKSDMTLNIPWANEESVCQTRSFSNLYVAFTALGAILGNDNEFTDDLKKYIKSASKLYRRDDEIIKSIANPGEITSVVTLGGGLQYGIVVEGAYIVVEMAEFSSNYYQLLEYRHGPIATAGKGTAVFICAGMSDEHERKMAGEIRATGAKVYAVAAEKVDWADHTFSMDEDHSKESIALYFAFIMQSFAYHFSVARGKNPDSPGNLPRYIMY